MPVILDSNEIKVIDGDKNFTIETVKSNVIVNQDTVINEPVVPILQLETTVSSETIDETYKYMAFTHSGGSEDQTEYSVTFNADTECDILIVSGGGGGGGSQISSRGGGGGGAGEYELNTGVVINAGTNFTIVVGKGGEGGDGTSSTQSVISGKNGISSVILQGSTVVYEAIGGGGGGGGKSGTGSNGLGGACGGGSTYQGVVGPGTKGFNGGQGGNNYFGGGGGGMGSSGGNSSSTSGGNGGNGVIMNITGIDIEVCGGGGGGGYTETYAGAAGGGGDGVYGGGDGGGFNSFVPGSSYDGIDANSYGGGGGGSTIGDVGSSAGYGGNGGSGIVIIRYKVVDVMEPQTLTHYTPERMYPPTRDLASASHLISGESYGNGVYEVSESDGTYDPTKTGFSAFNTSMSDSVHFNNKYTNGVYNGSDYIVPGYLGDWIKIKFPRPIKLTKYGFKQRTTLLRAPGKYKLYGSNDGTNWDVLVHKITTVSYTQQISVANDYFEENINVNNQYQYFGLVVNQLNGNEQILNFDEWYIYGKEFISEEPEYKTLTFTYEAGYELYNTQTSYSVNFPEDTECDILIVGGGGGGANDAGGGGGGGGVILAESIILNGMYNIKVGKGGDDVSTNNGNNGKNSELEGIIALGGGGGRGWIAEVGHDGGSGGGGGANNGSSPNTNGSSTQSKDKTTYGFLYTSTENGARLNIYGEDGGDGGINSTSSDFYDALGGGGGGANQVGYSGTSSNGANAGKGGDGINLSHIFGNTVGENGYFAGGGGGGSDGNIPTGLPGLGGGGQGYGQVNTPNINGKPNTGGGGGGAYRATLSGSGGSGIVIIRYKTQYQATTHGAQWTYHSANPNTHHYGNVGIGTTASATQKLLVNGDMNVTGNYKQNDNTIGNWYKAGTSIYRASGNVGIGNTAPQYSLHVHGGVYAGQGGTTGNGTTVWTSTSDSRMKDNIFKASYKECYDIFKKIELYRYNFKPGHVNSNDRNQLGFIAQEVQQQIPNSVEPRSIRLSSGVYIHDILTLNVTQINYILYGTFKYLIAELDIIKKHLESQEEAGQTE